jgi:hypothetical protein
VQIKADSQGAKDKSRREHGGVAIALLLDAEIGLQAALVKHVILKKDRNRNQPTCRRALSTASPYVLIVTFAPHLLDRLLDCCGRQRLAGEKDPRPVFFSQLRRSSQRMQHEAIIQTLKLNWLPAAGCSLSRFGSTRPSLSGNHG